MRGEPCFRQGEDVKGVVRDKFEETGRFVNVSGDRGSRSDIEVGKT